jgi:hypothetical protein
VKLPDRKDPHGDLEGSLLRGDVLEVLFRHNISIRHQPDDMVELELDDLLEVLVIPEIVFGRLIRRLSRIFAIDVTEFYGARRHHVH